MFCPKCGVENPDNGKFCRSCRANISNVSAALTGKSPDLPYTIDPRKRGVSWQNAITKISTGVAFLVISLILGLTGKISADKWWFWLLIPAFTLVGSGVAQIFQLKKIEKIEAGFAPQDKQNTITSSQNNHALPPMQTDYIKPQGSIYDTGEFVVQPSVTENTTRHLTMNSEVETTNSLNK